MAGGGTHAYSLAMFGLLIALMCGFFVGLLSLISLVLFSVFGVLKFSDRAKPSLFSLGVGLSTLAVIGVVGTLVLFYRQTLSLSEFPISAAAGAAWFIVCTCGTMHTDATASTQQKHE